MCCYRRKKLSKHEQRVTKTRPTINGRPANGENNVVRNSDNVEDIYTEEPSTNPKVTDDRAIYPANNGEYSYAQTNNTSNNEDFHMTDNHLYR